LKFEWPGVLRLISGMESGAHVPFCVLEICLYGEILRFGSNTGSFHVLCASRYCRKPCQAGCEFGFKPTPARRWGYLL